MRATLPPSIDRFEDLLPMFDHDRDSPLDIRTIGTMEKDDVLVDDVEFVGQGSKRVRAYLVNAVGEGPLAGVIFVHPAPGNRSTFLDESLALARKGVVSLLIEAPWARGEEWGRTMGDPMHDREQFVHTALDLRRGTDVLASILEMDPKRIGYVGHSLGALMGGLLAGVEKRIQAFVLMTGVGSFTDVAALNIPSLGGNDLERYSEIMSLIDPIYYIGHAAPAALCFQIGRNDEYFGQDKLTRFAEAGSEPKLIERYDAGHFLNQEARVDRMEWFTERLVLSP